MTETPMAMVGRLLRTGAPHHGLEIDTYRNSDGILTLVLNRENLESFPESVRQDFIFWIGFKLQEINDLGVPIMLEVIKKRVM